jgi:type I restriction enzyme R subunit
MTDLTEKAFEDAIEAALLAGGPDAPVTARERPASGPFMPGGFHRRTSADYDRARVLIPNDLLTFVRSTQPQAWRKLRQHLGARAGEEIIRRVSKEVEKRGVLDVLRRGVKFYGVRLKLAYFLPASGLNPDLQRKHQGNIFSVIRQLHFSQKSDQSLDMVLFLNGLPLFTAELKNPFTRQNVTHAMAQYRRDRDPHEPLFHFGRCLAHFAVDPDLVYFTTHLQGQKTRFFPFNKGNHGGAGNPPVLTGYRTSYLWEQIWARDSILDLIQNYIHIIDLYDNKGRVRGKAMIFPRYHQLDAVRRLVDEARTRGAGQRYLIQHSAGSGKSFTIAWLAHQLASLHDDQDRAVFDSVIIISDRRVIDRQLQDAVSQFEQVRGVVENIDKTSRQLREALESGKKIIVTTLQKFPVIAEQVRAMPGQRFAVIIDEAHSSQSGESVKDMKKVLSAHSLEEAAAEEEREPETMEDRVAAEMAARKQPPNVSFFAFTATPKPKTLELFGQRHPDGSYHPFSLYSMPQAIEEGFFLDVLQNYTTYKTYWNLLKTIQEDPRYEKGKAQYLLRRFVDLHPHAIEKKVAIIVEHFADHVAHRINDRPRP